MKTYSRKNSSYLKKAFIGSNFNEMCRLCLSEVDMVLTPIIQDYKISYQEWIHYSVDVLIEEGDGLPPNICEECLAMVEQTYLFKKKCKASDSKLREHLELIELNEEEKLNGIGFNDSLDKDVFTKQHPSESKCDESSAVDSGGTNAEPPTEVETDKEPIDEPPVIPDVPPVITDVPPVIPDVPPVITDVPPVITDVPPVITDVPSVITNVENEKVIEEVTTVKIPQQQLVLNRVYRYILRGEKRADDQEEDFTVCEVVPLDVRNEEESETLNEPINTNLVQNLHMSKKTGRIQEIYQLWENEEEEDEENFLEKKNKESIVEEKNDENVLQIDKENVLQKDEENSGQEPEKNEKVLEMTVESEDKTTDKETEVEEDEEENSGEMRRIYMNKNQIQIIETMPQSKRFKCFVCNKHFSSSAKLKYHLVDVHKEVAETAVCDVCCKSFTCSNSLKRHMIIHSGFKPFKCKVCDRTFSQSSILKRHILTHESVKPFNCHICKKGYTQKMNLLSHLKSHGLKTESESYRCKECKKSFVHQSGLSRHLKLHKGIRFLCVHCKRIFIDPSALARHVKAIHPKNKSPTKSKK